MNVGKLLMILGVILLILGFLISYAPGLTHWFGRLPGDIRLRGENWFVFVPITSIIMLSVILTILINLFFRK